MKPHIAKALEHEANERAAARRARHKSIGDAIQTAARSVKACTCGDCLLCELSDFRRRAIDRVESYEDAYARGDRSPQVVAVHERAELARARQNERRTR